MCQGGVFCLEHNMLGWLDGIQMPEKWDWLVRGCDWVCTP